MKSLYLVKLSNSIRAWDYMNEAVVCCTDEKNAKVIFTQNQSDDFKDLETKVVLLGVAEDGVKEGLVSASFIHG
mgnify:CR=1 FL=1